MHLDLRLYLDQVALTHPSDPLAYLWEYAPVHAWWWRERNRDRQPLGFLTYHRLLIRSFRRTFPGAWIPVQPASLVPFPILLAEEASSLRDLDTLQRYSGDLESWSRGVHHTFGGSVRDRERSIFERWFWEFHVFLDSQFSTALAASGLPWPTYLASVPAHEQRLV